jgi:hypothetical protein
MMRLAFLPLAALLAAAPAAGGAAHPLRDRADRSFSPIPLGTMRPPARLGLREVRANGCHAFGECDWADGRDVRHYFRERDELVVKSVRARDRAGRPIAALGIGRARARADVVGRVRAFLPDVRIDCVPEPPRATRCDASLDEGWLRLWFDANDGLTEVRLDARHFT